MKPVHVKNGNRIVGGMTAVSGLFILKSVQGDKAAERFDEHERRAFGLIGLGLVIVGVGMAILPEERAENGGFGNGGKDDDYTPFDPDGGGDAIEVTDGETGVPEEADDTDPLEGFAENADKELADLVDSAR